MFVLRVMVCEYLILTFDKLHLVYINIDRKVIRMTVVVLVYKENEEISIFFVKILIHVNHFERNYFQY